MKNILKSATVSIGFGLVFAFLLGFIARILDLTVERELLGISAGMVAGLVAGFYRRILQLKVR